MGFESNAIFFCDAPTSSAQAPFLCASRLNRWDALQPVKLNMSPKLSFIGMFSGRPSIWALGYFWQIHDLTSGFLCGWKIANIMAYAFIEQVF